MVPSWSSATRSASSTVEARWATTRPVVSARTRRSASSTSRSVCTSSADSVSSRTRTRGSASTARASARRCRWPPERAIPCSPTRVSRPQGRSWTKPAWLTSIAERIWSSSASARPSVRFSRALMEKSVGSSKAVATSERRWARLMSRTSTPSMVTRPAVTSYRRGTSPVRIVFPEPVAPTSATVSPGATSRLTSRSTSSSGASGNAKSTCSRRRWPRGRSTTAVPETMSGSVSKISRMRAAAVMASWPIARITFFFNDTETTESISVMNATSSPGVSSPWPTPMAPSSRTTTTARLGMTSRKVQNFADSRTLSMLVACRVRAAASYWAATRDDDVGLLEAHREPHDRCRGRGHDQPERPVHVQEDPGHDGDLEDVDHQEEQPEAAEPADRRQVRGRTREQLPGLPLRVEAHRQLLQPLVEVVPHRGLEAEHRVGLHPAPDPDQHCLEHAQPEGQQAQRQHRADLAVGDRAVDQRLGHQWDRDREADPGDRRQGHDSQRQGVRAEVAPQSPERVDAGGRVRDRDG